MILNFLENEKIIQSLLFVIKCKLRDIEDDDREDGANYDCSNDGSTSCLPRNFDEYVSIMFFQSFTSFVFFCAFEL